VERPGRNGTGFENRETDNMHILPAVDIRGGRAVRLFQGRADRETVYDDSPADAARRWADAGATWLHVVDLDGAFEGESPNEPHIRAIVEAVGVPVEVGGGVRSVEKARRLLEAGAARVIVGTRAATDPAFLAEILETFPNRIAVGVDARDGRVAIRGWTESTGQDAETFLRSLSGSGAAAVIYTDIARDGALEGPNVEAMRRATEATDVPVIASGGVTTADDIRALGALSLEGIIVGKALYDGRLTLGEALEALPRPAGG
jgi:phosphoribosylformimino-5-aminoimidazole carboxamide ribotide isomerase